MEYSSQSCSVHILSRKYYLYMEHMLWLLSLLSQALVEELMETKKNLFQKLYDSKFANEI